LNEIESRKLFFTAKSRVEFINNTVDFFLNKIDTGRVFNLDQVFAPLQVKYKALVRQIFIDLIQEGLLPYSHVTKDGNLYKGDESFFNKIIKKYEKSRVKNLQD
jgi:hypothetical protein